MTGDTLHCGLPSNNDNMSRKFVFLGFRKVKPEDKSNYDYDKGQIQLNSAAELLFQTKTSAYYQVI